MQGISFQVSIAMICKERSIWIAMVFDEKTNYDFILLSKQGRTQLI